MLYDDGDALQNTWPDSSQRVHARWSQLTDNDVKSIDGQAVHLISRLQERYGYARDRAEQECQEFIDALETSMERGSSSNGSRGATASNSSTVREQRAATSPTRGESRPTERSMPSGNSRAPGSPAPQSVTSRSNSHVTNASASAHDASAHRASGDGTR